LLRVVGAPYTYLWDNGAGTGATATVSPSSTTTYNVTVTDACLATATGSITVTVNPLPTATAGSNSPVCVGADLNLTATTDIGTSFAWAGPNTFTASTQNPSITGATLAATGTYTVTVTAAGCSRTATTAVVVVSSPTVTASASPATICVGSSSTLTANAGITPASGTPTYCFNTSANTGTNDCVSNVVFGTISKSSSTINNGTGYVNNTSISTNVNCGASYTLALTVGAYSSANYIAAWIDYNNDGTFSAGEKVAQSGALGTVATFSTTVAIPYLASNASVRMRVREAYGAIDGANMSPCGSVTHGEVEDYTVNIIAPAYTYLWNDPSAATTSTLSVTPATTTTYTVTVTSAGCAITSSVTVTVNSATVAGITNNTGSTELTCNTTSISVTATGGTTYAWSGGATPGTAANSFNAAGTYTVTVTGSNGCSSTAAITITSNTTPPSASATSTNTCAGSSIGTATVTASGGTGPYTYTWAAAPAFVVDHMPKTAAHPYFGVGSGTGYTIDGVEGKELTLVRGVTYTFDLTMVAGSHPWYITDDAVGAGAGTQYTTPSFGTTITFTPTGAMPNLLYYQCANHPNMGWKINLVDMVAPNQLANLSAGTYTATVTGANGCSSTASTTVTANPSPTPTATATPTTVCNGGNSQLNVTGLATGYSVNSTTYGLQPTTGFVAGPSGYDVISAAIPLPFTFNYFGSNKTQLFINTNGQIGFDYTGSWANEQRNAQTIPDSTLPNDNISLCWADLNEGAGQITYGVVAGTVAPNQIFVVNFNAVPFFSGGDVLSGQIQLYEATQQIQIHVASFTNNVALKTLGIENASGTVGVAATGRNNVNWLVSTPEAWSFTPFSYTYVWSPATFLSSTTIANPLASGVTATTTYTVTVTNLATGCTGTSSVTVTPSAPISAASITPASPAFCTGSSVTLTAVPANGGEPYTYAWADPSNNPAGTAATQVANVAGLWSVTVTDNCGGTTTTSVTVTVNPLPSAAITANPSGAAICGTGSVTLDVLPGATTYAWLPATGLSATNTASVTASPTATTTYTVTVTGSNGCSSTAAITITSNTTPPTAGLTNNGPLTCALTSVTLTGTGGVSYAYSGGLASVTAPGTYTVTVTSANGCTATATTEVMQDVTAPTAGLTNNGPLTCALTSVTLTGTGGGTYAYSSGPSGITAPGTYTVTVTGTNGCTATATTTTTTTIASLATASNNGPVCEGGTIIMSVNPNLPVGVTATYFWVGGAGTATIQSPSIKTMTPAKTGLYTVTVTYSNGCTATATTTLVMNPKPVISSVASTCVAGSGRITVNATGTGLTYNIGAGAQTSNVFNGLANGTYTVTVTNSTGCTAKSTINVFCQTCPTPLASNNGPVCVGGNFILSVNPALPNGVTASYYWNGPAGIATLQNPTIPNATPS
jgi:hypothetical protein